MPGQVTAGGLDTARTVTLDIAEREGLEVKWFIELAGIKGARVRGTKQMKELIRLITVEGCRDVVMKEISRLMRADKFSDYDIIDVFKKYGVRVHLPQKSFDLSISMEVAFFQFLLMNAAQEKEVLKERTYGKRIWMQNEGMCASGRTTLGLGIGYDRDGSVTGYEDVYYPITDNGHGINEADLALRVFQLFTSGETCFRTIAQKTGISYNSIGPILENTSYHGYRTYDEVVDPDLDVYNPDDTLKYHKRVKKEHFEPVPMRGFLAGPKVDGRFLFQPIVSDAMFAYAQQLLAIKRDSDLRGSRGDVEDDPFLFRGFLRCHHCQSKLLHLRLKVNYYCCQRTLGKWRVRKDGALNCQIPYGSCKAPRVQNKVLDPMLDIVVAEQVSNPSFLYRLLESRREEVNSDALHDRADSIRHEIEKTEVSLTRIKRLYVKQEYTEAEYDAEARVLKAQLDEQRKALTACVPSIPKISKQYLAEKIQAFGEWEYLTRGQKRRLLSAVFPYFRVRLDGNGRSGRCAKTSAEIKGFWLNLAGLDALGSSIQPSTNGTRLESAGSKCINSAYHSLLVRIRRDPGKAHPPCLQLDEEKHVVRDQTFEGKDFHGEEVGPGQHFHVGANEVAPARRMLALWCWGNAMALENITHCLVGNAMSEIGERSHHAIVAP
jgi:DNA invertase Pin-like site-specific DNA recombinase